MSTKDDGQVPKDEGRDDGELTNVDNSCSLFQSPPVSSPPPTFLLIPPFQKILKTGRATHKGFLCPDATPRWRVSRAGWGARVFGSVIIIFIISTIVMK